MYTRKTPMTRLINRLIERTVSLVSALRALPMGPMPTMLTSPLGQAGIRPLPALASKPLADPEERRRAMRISKRFKLCLMAVLVGLAMHSGLVAAAESATATGTEAGKEQKKQPANTAAGLIVSAIISKCNKFDTDKDYQTCVSVAFAYVCPTSKASRHFDDCKEMYDNLKLRGSLKDITWACATKETGDQLCLISPTRVSSGDLLPISIDIGDLNDGTVDNVMVTVHVSTAFGTLTQPYRDPENPGDFDLTWTGGPDDWVGTASLESISGTVSAQPVFGMGDVPADDSVTITGHVDYTRDGFSESMDVLYSVEVPGETAVTPDAVTPE